jgi:hypothetical protein
LPSGLFSYILVASKQSTALAMTETIATSNAGTIKLDISTDSKTTILLNVEGEVKELIAQLAQRSIPDAISIDEDKLSALPSSMTGVMVHYLCKGLKDDFNIEFKEKPVSLKPRNTSNYDKKVAGKKRLLTKEQKNELLAKMQMSYYEEDIAKGYISMDDAISSIKSAFEKKQELEEMGYILPAKKTESPYWLEDQN